MHEVLGEGDLDVAVLALRPGAARGPGTRPPRPRRWPSGLLLEALAQHRRSGRAAASARATGPCAARSSPTRWFSSARFSVSASGMARSPPTGSSPISSRNCSTSSVRMQGRAASWTSTQSSLAMRASRCFSALSTLSARCAPPQNAASTLSGSALQSCCAPVAVQGREHHEELLDARRPPRAPRSSGTSSACRRAGCTAWERASPMRVPCPAASTSANTFGMEGFDGGLHYTVGPWERADCFALLACLAVGCEEAPKPIAPIAESGELVVLTVNGPSTYFEDAQGLPSGSRVRPRHAVREGAGREGDASSWWTIPRTSTSILRKGQAHLAAAALARHFDFPGGLAWGPSYHSTQHQIVCRAEDRRRRSSRTSRASASA